MNREKPWAKFYFSDWRSDPALRMCGIAARGLWIEMLALMHEAEPYGFLLVRDQQPTIAQLSVLVGAGAEDVAAMLSELETAGVFSRNRAGVIYSRRMVRDEKSAKTSRKNGKMGGNPSLGKQKGISDWDNPPLKAKSLESRDKREEKEDPSLSDGSKTTTVGPDFADPAAPPKPPPPEPATAGPDAVPAPGAPVVNLFGDPPPDRPPSDLTKKATRLPPDWWLTRPQGEWAMARQFTDQQVRDMAQAFRAYYLAAPGQKGLRLSWEQAWRSWVLKEAKQRAENAARFRPKESADGLSAVRQAIRNDPRYRGKQA